MNLYDRLKKFHREVFLKRQAVIAHETAAEDFTVSQDVTPKAMKAATETIKLANELAADNDPHIKRLALLIKDSVVGADGRGAGALRVEWEQHPGHSSDFGKCRLLLGSPLY